MSANLISRTLGTILLQSVNDIPNHVANIGSVYSNIDTGVVFISKGSGNWEPLTGVSYAEAFYQGNVNTTTISSANWFQVSNNFTLGNSSGFTVTTNRLVLGAGRSGKYHVTADFTIQNVSGLASYDCGVSINGNNPQNGRFNTGTINATFTLDNVSTSFDTVLNSNDELTLAVRNITNTNSIIVRHAQLNVYRIE
jgi:hypothetical protein